MGVASVAEWSLCVSTSDRVAMETRDRETGNPHSPIAFSTSCGARYLIVWSDGLVSRGSLERRQIETDPESAIATARAAAYDDPDAARVAGPAAIPDVLLEDPAVSRILQGKEPLPAARWRGLGERVDSAGMRTWSGSLHLSRSETLIRTSKGLAAGASGTHASWHASVNGEIAEGHSGRSFESDSDFDARLGRLLKTAELLERTAPPLPAGNQQALLHPDVVDRLVISTLLHHLDAATVAHGESRFAAAQFGSGEAVLREDLSVRIDPRIPLRAGSYRFTAEGIPAAECVYVERGRLVTPVATLKYAHRLGIVPTPSPHGSDVLFLEAGERLGLDDALGSAGASALVLNVLGVHTQDSSSGHFSLSAPQVLRLGQNGPVGRVRATLSGNVFDLLRSDDLRFVAFPGEHVPGMLVRCRLDPR